MFGSRVKSNNVCPRSCSQLCTWTSFIGWVASLISWRCLDHELLLNLTMSFYSLKQINTKRQKWKTPTQDTHCRLRENTGCRLCHPLRPYVETSVLAVSIPHSHGPEDTASLCQLLWQNKGETFLRQTLILLSGFPVFFPACALICRSVSGLAVFSMWVRETACSARQKHE